MKEVLCPLQYETCIRSMLYNYRIKNKKDFFECDIQKIKKAFEKCEDSINCMNQEGGNISNQILISIKSEIKQLTQKKKHIKHKLNDCNKLLCL